MIDIGKDGTWKMGLLIDDSIQYTILGLKERLNEEGFDLEKPILIKSIPGGGLSFLQD